MHLEKQWSKLSRANNLYSDPDDVFKDMNISDEHKNELILNIKKKMAPQPVKIRADFEMTCFTKEGVDGIKEAIL